MAGSAITTTNHDEIREWVEARDGRPVRVRGTGSDSDPGILRIDFPGGAGEEQLEPISWTEWFEKFDANNPAFLYQETRKSDEESTFFKLVSRETVREQCGA